jgi:hypothetical protein
VTVVACIGLGVQSKQWRCKDFLGNVRASRLAILHKACDSESLPGVANRSSTVLSVLLQIAVFVETEEKPETPELHAVNISARAIASCEVFKSARSINARQKKKHRRKSQKYMRVEQQEDQSGK